MLNGTKKYVQNAEQAGKISRFSEREFIPARPFDLNYCHSSDVIRINANGGSPGNHRVYRLQVSTKEHSTNERGPHSNR